jgi:hypothetical protein
MPSSADIARIKADLAMLEKARDSCTDGGLRKVIDAWIQDAMKTLANALESPTKMKPPCE